MLTVVGLFAYLYLYSTLVVTLENEERRILGFVCMRTRRRYNDVCPRLDEVL